MMKPVKGLLEASSVTGCDNLLIITDDEKDTFQISGKRIDVMPAWEWLLGKVRTRMTSDHKAKNH